MTDEPESLLPLPKVTEPLEPESDELESDELESDELESEELVLVDVLVAVSPVLAACAIAATPIVPPTLSASSVPVATASRRRPCSRPAGLGWGVGVTGGSPLKASMPTPSAPRL